MFFIAFSRVFVTSFTDFSNAEVRVTEYLDNTVLTYKSYIFGLMFFGNLIDNMVDPKPILIICEACVAV